MKYLSFFSRCISSNKLAICFTCFWLVSVFHLTSAVSGLAQTYRSLFNNGVVVNTYVMSVSSDGSGGRIVTTSVQSPILGDNVLLQLLDGLMKLTPTTFQIPNDGNQYWWVPFDDTYIPLKIEHGTVEVRCGCFAIGQPGCQPGYVVADDQFTCIKETCEDLTCILDVKKGSITYPSGGGVILKATAVKYNGVSYS